MMKRIGGQTGASFHRGMTIQKCKCGRPCVVGMWEFDGMDQARRHHFKCADIDPDFMVL
jgi:hypothetical protein